MDMDARAQVGGLFQAALNEMTKQASALSVKLANQFPPAPRPRAPLRYITDSLKVMWSKDEPQSAVGFKFYERVLTYNRARPARWRQISEEVFIDKLRASCATPRRAARALARLDAYTRWLADREHGLDQARENLLRSQSKWVACIDARIGGAEMAGVSLNPKAAARGPGLRGAAQVSWAHRPETDLQSTEMTVSGKARKGLDK